MKLYNECIAYVNVAFKYMPAKQSNLRALNRIKTVLIRKKDIYDKVLTWMDI